MNHEHLLLPNSVHKHIFLPQSLLVPYSLTNRFIITTLHYIFLLHLNVVVWMYYSNNIEELFILFPPFTAYALFLLHCVRICVLFQAVANQQGARETDDGLLLTLPKYIVALLYYYFTDPF